MWRTRLPPHRHQRLVPAPLPDPRAAASGGGGVRDDSAGLARRHFGRRCADPPRAVDQRSDPWRARRAPSGSRAMTVR